MRKTVVKLLCYMTAISLGALIDGAVQISLNLGTFVAMFCCITEATSVVENLGRITGHDAFEKLKDIFGNKRNSLQIK
jgi:phage-related holin